VAQRDLEKLGESDRGIIMFRRMLLDQIKLMEEGRPMMNVYDGEGPTDPIHLPIEDVKFGQTRVPAYRPGEAGESPDVELIVATLNTWNRDPAAADHPLEAASSV
jgi:hypothetical protein